MPELADTPLEELAEKVADWLERVFGPDVAFCQHADPMTRDDWLSLARGCPLLLRAQALEKERDEAQTKLRLLCDLTEYLCLPQSDLCARCGHKRSEHPYVGRIASWPTRCYYCDCLAFVERIAEGDKP